MLEMLAIEQKEKILVGEYKTKIQKYKNSYKRKQKTH